MRMSDREGERATLGAKRGEIPKGCWRPGSTSGRHAAGRRCRRLSPPGRMMGREGGGGRSDALRCWRHHPPGREHGPLMRVRVADPRRSLDTAAQRRQTAESTRGRLRGADLSGQPAQTVSERAAGRRRGPLRQAEAGNRRKGISALIYAPGGGACTGDGRQHGLEKGEMRRDDMNTESHAGPCRPHPQQGRCHATVVQRRA